MNPTCCIPPRAGAFLAGTFDLIFSLLGVSWSFELILLSPDSILRWTQFGIGITFLLLPFLLLTAVAKESVLLIRMWLLVWLILILGFFSFGILSSFLNMEWGLNDLGVYPSSVAILLFLYQLWIIINYYQRVGKSDMEIQVRSI